MTERELQHEPQALEGEDELPRRPAPTADPYTPEPGPGRSERRAFRGLQLSWLPFAVLLAILVYSALR
jgi:hypothetical protein